jgi:hypothetical protein
LKLFSYYQTNFFQDAVNRLLEAQDKLRSEEETRAAAETQVKELQARLEGLSGDLKSASQLKEVIIFA